MELVWFCVMGLIVALIITINVQHAKIKRFERDSTRNKEHVLTKENELHNAYKKLNDVENYLILETAKSDGLTAANKQLENQLKIKQQIIEKLERKLKNE